MLNCAEELCGTRVVSEKIKSELKTSVAPKISVDPEFLNSSVVTRPTSEITVKAR